MYIYKLCKKKSQINIAQIYLNYLEFFHMHCIMDLDLYIIFIQRENLYIAWKNFIYY